MGTPTKRGLSVFEKRKQQRIQTLNDSSDDESVKSVNTTGTIKRDTIIYDERCRVSRYSRSSKGWIAKGTGELAVRLERAPNCRLIVSVYPTMGILNCLVCGDVSCAPEPCLHDDTHTAVLLKLHCVASHKYNRVFCFKFKTIDESSCFMNIICHPQVDKALYRRHHPILTLEIFHDDANSDSNDKNGKILV